MNKKELALLSLGVATIVGIRLAYLAKSNKNKYLTTGPRVR